MFRDTPETHLWPPRPANPPPSLGSPGRISNPGARTNTSCFPWVPPPTCWYLSLLENPTQPHVRETGSLKSNGLQVLLPHASFSSQGASLADGSLFTHLAKLHTQALFSSFPLPSCCLSSSHATIHHNLVVYHFIRSRMAVIRKPEITSFGWMNG